MDPKDRFEACLKLADFWSGRHDGRREYEWKVALGFWAVLLAAIHYAPDIRGKVVWNSCYTLIGVAAVWALYCMFWLFPLWRRNQQDKEQALFYVAEATASLTDPNHKVKIVDYKDIEAGFTGFIRDWAQRFHALVTAVLLLAFWMAVTRP